MVVPVFLLGSARNLLLSVSFPWDPATERSSKWTAKFTNVFCKPALFVMFELCLFNHFSMRCSSESFWCRKVPAKQASYLRNEGRSRQTTKCLRTPSNAKARICKIRNIKKLRSIIRESYHEHSGLVILKTLSEKWCTEWQRCWNQRKDGIWREHRQIRTERKTRRN